jgi:hypothetical protein
MIAAGPLSLPASDAIRLRAGETDTIIVRRVPRVSRSSRASTATVMLFAVVVCLTVAGGWLFRDRNPLTPKSGPGYALGIAGGVAMVLLCLYSARKHLRFMRGWGIVGHWFRIHMLLGVLGPVLILFHCNFRLGAPNSNVALFSMLVVAASGVVGRYIYTRLSHGLYGARATLEELHAQLSFSAHTLGERLPPASRASQRLAAFATTTHAPHRMIGERLFRLVALPLLAMWVHRRVLHDLRLDLEREAEHGGSDARTRRANEAVTRKIISAYIATLVKEIQFSAYERLFSLWHALHIPLFIMLLLTGIMHVIAVHMY